MKHIKLFEQYTPGSSGGVQVGHIFDGGYNFFPFVADTQTVDEYEKKNQQLEFPTEIWPTQGYAELPEALFIVMRSDSTSGEDYFLEMKGISNDLANRIISIGGQLMYATGSSGSFESIPRDFTPDKRACEKALKLGGYNGPRPIDKYYDEPADLAVAVIPNLKLNAVYKPSWQGAGSMPFAISKKYPVTDSPIMSMI